jgi:hypothetical protein
MICSGIAKKKTKINKICIVCNTEFQVHEYRDTEAKYCSHNCYLTVMQNLNVTITCQNCGNNFEIIYSQRNRIKNCSRKCRNEYDRRFELSGLHTCTTCKEEKPVNQFYVNTIANRPWATCITCNKQRHKKYNNTTAGKASRARITFRRRSLLKKTATLTANEWKTILDKYENKCAYCGKLSDTIEMDHIIPVSKGGTHTKCNVVPACRTCNRTKAAKLHIKPMTPEETKGILL